MSSSSIDNPAASAPHPHHSTETYPRDVSCEIGLALDNAYAIADLIFTVLGSRPDGSESRIDDLAVRTLRAALHCIMTNVEAAEGLQPEHDDHTRAMALRGAQEDAKAYRELQEVLPEGCWRGGVMSAATLRGEEASAHPTETPSARLRALLARTRPLVGCNVAADYWGGRPLVEKLALALETGTECEWSLSDCARVLRFLAFIQPTEGSCICDDRSDINATCGLHTIYGEIADRLEVSHGE